MFFGNYEVLYNNYPKTTSILKVKLKKNMYWVGKKPFFFCAKRWWWLEWSYRKKNGVLNVSRINGAVLAFIR
ncbi:hypothetical protein DW278_17050 [Clostridium botulinum]|nr:hypothetical protein [Clostridium botulinum]